MFFHALMLTVLIVAMSKERLELEQRLKAQTDPLTGALNRRAFMARGGRLAQRHQHEGAPLCLLFLDLDHFKSLNDRFGHSGGDDVLMTFVTVVHANIRPTDFLFRIGGEEFCCLLPHTRTDQARIVAERIRQQFEMATVDVAGTPVKATVSLGIASTEAFGYDLDTLMRRADMAVYAAKRQGRNRVVAATVDDAAHGRPDGPGGLRLREGRPQGHHMPITIYGIKNCDTMKKARAWLDKHGVAYDFHDYKTAGIERERLERWGKKVGWETLLNRAGTTFRKLPDKDKAGDRREEGDRADARAAVDDQAAGARISARQAGRRASSRSNTKKSLAGDDRHQSSGFLNFFFFFGRMGSSLDRVAADFVQLSAGTLKNISRRRVLNPPGQK